MRESVSFKKLFEEHIRITRDRLHYRLNKSDLYKYLIRKDSHLLETKHQSSYDNPEEEGTYGD